MKNKLIFIIICVLTGISQSLATTYYVSSNGNDNNTGLSIANPFKTIQHAVDLVTAGDSVLVTAGQYSGFDMRTGGNSGSPIVIQAIEANVEITSPGPVTDDGINVENADWIIIDGFIVNDMPRNGIRVVLSDFVIIRNNQCDHNFERGIFTGFTDHILIENNICTNSIDEHGIYFSNSGDFPIIRNNVCHHNRGAGIQINADLSAGGDGITTGAVIEGNILYENGTGGGAAINLDGAVESLVANNLLYNNHATGIALFRQDAAIGARDNKIYNNTVIQAPDARWCININTGSTGATLHNNILITFHSFRGSIAVDNSSVQGFSSDYNIVVDRLTSRGDDFSDPFSSWQQDGYGLHSMLADPMADIFVDSSILDFHLLQNSQAINTGKDLTAEGIITDLDSVSRPQGNGFDIGAFEFASSTSISPFKEREKTVRVIENTVEFYGLFPGDEIMIADLRGRILYQKQVSGNQPVRIQLPSQLYIFSVSHPSRGRFEGKLLIRE